MFFQISSLKCRIWDYGGCPRWPEWWSRHRVPNSDCSMRAQLSIHRPLMFFFWSFLSFIFFAGRCAYVESKVTDLPYFASKAWKTTILDMLSLSSKLMRGGHDMIWLRVFLLVFGVLSQKNKHPFTRWPSERTVLKRCILLETSTNTTLGWRLVLHKHWPRSTVFNYSPSHLGESLQDEFPFHEVISHFYDYRWLWEEEGSTKDSKA